MKVLHIFGAVVAVHVAVFLIIFAVPGCRSTHKANQVASGEGDPAGEITPVAAAPVDSVGVTPPAGTTYGGAATVRFSPTRPNTPAAGAVQQASAPAPDVTAANTYTVAKNDSLWTIARKNGVSVAEISRANNFSGTPTLRPGQKIIIPAKGGKASAPSSSGGSAAPVSGGDSNPTYEVRPGDTLAGIAKKHGITVARLKTLNQLRSDTVKPGQKLSLPSGVAEVNNATAPANSVTSPKAAPAAGSNVHVVEVGETLSGIAKRYGVTRRELIVLNNIPDDTVRPGQRIKLPAKARSVAPAPAETTPAPAALPPEATAPAVDPNAPVAVPPTTNAPEVPVIKVD